MYRHLESEKIVDTIEILCRRIDERFPQSGIGNVARELLKTGQQAKERCRWLVKPLWALRLMTWFLIVLIVASFLPIISKFNFQHSQLTLTEFIQVLESGINDVVFLGIGIFFLVTVESRIKRRRVLSLLHELRAIAHVIDMHQLTKDPESLLTTYQQTKSSPKLTMTAFELQRYLDYCSELLSMIGKIAALYVQDFNDTEVVDVVNEIESLTNGLSRKIWQKIMILQSMYPRKDS